jgi:hypothetical protein
MTSRSESIPGWRRERRCLEWIAGQRLAALVCCQALAQGPRAGHIVGNIRPMAGLVDRSAADLRVGERRG